MVKLATFDIFDTCLIRASGAPVSVFWLLAKRVLKGNKDCDIFDFVQIRKNGERIARVNAKGEVTIHEIYGQCDFSALTHLSNDEILQIEMDIERIVLLPVKSIKEKIDCLRQSGVQIGFVSDMYLPSDFIKSILKESGLFKENDLLYVSSDNKKTKSNGSLFSFLKSQQPDVSLGLWMHYGDNLKSDWINAIKAGAFPKRIVHKYNEYEKYNELRFLPLIESNIKINRSISKALRLSKSDNHRYSFAVDIIAPIYVPFVWSLLSKSAKKNITDLYFFARDSLIFYKIAQIFSSFFNGIKLHYIYVSRKSIYYPTLEHFDEESVKSLFSKQDVSLYRILSDLHLRKDDFSKKQWSELNTFINKNDRIDYLFSQQNIKKILILRYEEQKTLFLNYLEQESIARHSNDCAIVDLRGTRKSHEKINQFLINNGYKPVFGYYFEVIEDRINPVRGGMYDSSIYRENFLSSHYYLALQNSTALFEQYFSITPHNRTSYYKRNDKGVVEPVFDNEILNKERGYIYNNNLKACVDFALLYYRLENYERPEIISQYFLISFLKLMIYPSRKFLKMFDGLKVTENEFDNRVFVKKLTPINFLKYDIVWKTGSAIYTYGTWLSHIFKFKRNIFQ